MIRKAEPKDKGAIQHLNQGIFDFEVVHCDPTENTNFPTSEIGQNFFDDVTYSLNGHFGYVFEDEDIVKGYVSLRVVTKYEYNHRKGISILQLQTLGVDERFRNEGIGRALVNHAKSVAKDLGFSHLKVVALAKNDRARHLYKECGFNEYEIHHEMEL